VIEILLALILVDGRETITSKARTFVVLELVTNVALFIFVVYYIILVNEQHIFGGVKRVFLTCFAASGNELYIFRPT
jgi:hypothetical protein